MIRIALVLCCLLPLPIFADGGKVEFRQTAGAYVITLFSSPVPLRVGTADLSVMVQNASDQSAVLDAAVTLRIDGASIPATAAQATNKILYAARVDFTRAGPTAVSVDVNGKATAPGQVDVFPAQPALIAYWPYFAVVPAAIMFYILNQFLQRRRNATRWPGQT